jgi:hypothetical protein
LGGRVVGAQAVLFFRQNLQKMREILLTFYVWRAVWCLPNGLERRLAQHFADFFFFQRKVRQQKVRKDPKQDVCRRIKRLKGFLNEAAKNVELKI